MFDANDARERSKLANQQIKLNKIEEQKRKIYKEIEISISNGSFYCDVNVDALIEVENHFTEKGYKVTKDGYKLFVRW